MLIAGSCQHFELCMIGECQVVCERIRRIFMLGQLKTTIFLSGCHEKILKIVKNVLSSIICRAVGKSENPGGHVVMLWAYSATLVDQLADLSKPEGDITSPAPLTPTALNSEYNVHHCFMNKVLVLQRIFIYSQAVSNRKMVKQRDNEPFSFFKLGFE